MLFKKVNLDTTPELKNDGVRYLEQKNCEAFLFVQNNLTRPLLALLRPRERRRAKQKRNSGDCTMEKNQCSRGDKCGMKHDPGSKREPKGQDKSSRPPSSSRRNSLEQRTPKGKSPSRKENQPTCFASKQGDCPKVNASDCWHPLECSCLFKVGVVNLGISVR